MYNICFGWGQDMGHEDSGAAPLAGQYHHKDAVVNVTCSNNNLVLTGSSDGTVEQHQWQECGDVDPRPVVECLVTT